MTKQEQIRELRNELRTEQAKVERLLVQINTARAKLSNPVKVCTGWYKGQTLRMSNVNLVWLRERVVAGSQLGKITVVEILNEGEDNEQMRFVFIDKPGDVIWA